MLAAEGSVTPVELIEVPVESFVHPSTTAVRVDSIVGILIL